MARELENPCGRLFGCTVACTAGTGKGRPRFGEGGSDGEFTVACIASLGKHSLDPGAKAVKCAMGGGQGLLVLELVVVT